MIVGFDHLVEQTDERFAILRAERSQYSLLRVHDGGFNCFHERLPFLCEEQAFCALVRRSHTRAHQLLRFQEAELTKVRSVKPDAVCVFYPGQAGAQFMQQYAQAGLKDSIPIYSVFTVNALTLPQIKEPALGHLSTQEWVQDLDNEANKRFVADFRKKYGRYPSHSIMMPRCSSTVPSSR
jgi:hypothetical protein